MKSIYKYPIKLAGAAMTWLRRWWFTRKAHRWARNVERHLRDVDPELAVLWRQCPLDPATRRGLEARLWLLHQLQRRDAGLEPLAFEGDLEILRQTEGEGGAAVSEGAR